MSAGDLAQQFELSKRIYDLRAKLEPIGKDFDALVENATKSKETDAAKEAVDGFMKKLEELAPPNRRPGTPPTFDALTKARALFAMLQNADVTPRPAVRNAVAQVEKSAPAAMAKWQSVITQDLPALNQQLQSTGLPPLDLERH